MAKEKGKKKRETPRVSEEDNTAYEKALAEKEGKRHEKHTTGSAKGPVDRTTEPLGTLLLNPKISAWRDHQGPEESDMKEYIDIILLTLPGITGLWQVSGRNELNFNDRLKLDAWYVQNWSLWLDIVLILKTVYVVITRKGAY